MPAGPKREYRFGAVFAIQISKMTGPKPPSWEEIQILIERADEVCRESEQLRARFERARKRPDFWPDRRGPARTNEPRDTHDRRNETRSTSEGNEGTL
jgi:hypothetical protein